MQSRYTYLCPNHHVVLFDFSLHLIHLPGRMSLEQEIPRKVESELNVVGAAQLVLRAASFGQDQVRLIAGTRAGVSQCTHLGH